MAKKLNQQEIREEIVRILTDTRDMYSMKELEVACRAKGISQKNAKGVIEKLSEEKIIQHAKFGVLVYYWIPASPLTSETCKREQVLKLTSTEDRLFTSIEALKSEVDKKINEGCDESETPKREQLLKKISDLRGEEKKLQTELNEINATSSKSDKTEDHEKMENNLKPLGAAVNRWTDNIFSAMEFTQEKLRLDDTKLLRKECKIPQNLDYID